MQSLTPRMTRFVTAAAVLVAVTAQAFAWPLPFGASTGNRVSRGAGTFPRWRALALATEAPVRWLVAFPPGRLAAVDGDGGLIIFELAPAGLRVAARYGGVASPDGPPVVARLDRTQTGVVLVAPDGRLLVWSDGVLRGYDVGAPLSSLTFPTPIAFEDRAAHDLLAITRDSAVVLIGGLAAGGPRVVARLDAHALPDGRITVADLDGDGVPEAAVLSDATGGYAHGALGDALEAGSLTVLRVRPYGLEVRARFPLPVPAVFEDLVPVLAPIGGSATPAILLARSVTGQGAAPVALGLRGSALVLLAAGPSLGRGNLWTHLIGAADLSGDGVTEVVAVATPHLDGVLTAYRRVGGALVAVGSAAGYASHAIGSRNLEQALIADLDGDGLPEVVVPRQSREVLVGLALRGNRFVERWAVDFKGPVSSNLVTADLDGDGLLDLAVAVRRGLMVFLSLR